MLKVVNLETCYGAIRALRGVSFEILSRGIFSIIGSNGAGKTTLLKTIMGITRAQQGKIIFDNTDITGLPTHQIVELGISLCPEGRRVFKSLTVEENLIAGGHVSKSHEDLRSRMEMVYEIFPRLKERRKQIAGTLSGGEQQMLALGRALMPRPRLLLLDEPSMGLAPSLVDLVFDTIVRIEEYERIPILLVEQNAEMALSVSNYSYVLEVGKLVLQGKGSELLRSPEVQKKYLGA